MQIRKTYKEINPELLNNELKDFAQKQGAILVDAKLETYSLPTDSSSFISRGTLIFMKQSKSGEADRECLRVHVVGSAKAETKVILDVDEKLFPQEKVSALLSDLDFIFGQYEEE